MTLPFAICKVRTAFPPCPPLPTSSFVSEVVEELLPPLLLSMPSIRIRLCKSRDTLNIMQIVSATHRASPRPALSHTVRQLFHPPPGRSAGLTVGGRGTPSLLCRSSGFRPSTPSLDATLCRWQMSKNIRNINFYKMKVDFGLMATATSTTGWMDSLEQRKGYQGGIPCSYHKR